MLKQELQTHLEEVIIPFWKGLRDYDCGGYYGYVGYDLKVDKKADKGCILNSRILWFFSNAYTLLGDASLLDEATHAYQFLRENCLDTQNGGIFWSIRHNGVAENTQKYTYNQAFAVYALSSYYEASKDEGALSLAFELFDLIEEKCTDKMGYREAFDEFFVEIENDQLSENDVIADKTMNTILHLMEAYTELYRVSTVTPARTKLKHKLEWLLSTIAEKVYNPDLRRLEVFFDAKMTPIIDLHSYGHDIEAAWLIDRAVEVLGNRSYFVRMTPIAAHLTDEIYKTAYKAQSVPYESVRGVVNETRTWWVQAEAVTGFFHAYKREPQRGEYLAAAEHIWEFIKQHIVDERYGGEWYNEVDKLGYPDPEMAIVDEWKCPYHNGRMCFEIISL